MLKILRKECRTTMLRSGWFKKSDLATRNYSFTLQMSTMFKLDQSVAGLFYSESIV